MMMPPLLLLLLVLLAAPAPTSLACPRPCSSSRRPTVCGHMMCLSPRLALPAQPSPPTPPLPALFPPLQAQEMTKDKKAAAAGKGGQPDMFKQMFRGRMPPNSYFVEQLTEGVLRANGWPVQEDAFDQAASDEEAEDFDHVYYGWARPDRLPLRPRCCCRGRQAGAPAPAVHALRGGSADCAPSTHPVPPPAGCCARRPPTATAGRRGSTS
jgi:hypothetical protein